MIEIPDPRDAEWSRWVAELAFQDPTIPFPPPETDWRDWAGRLALNTTIGLLNPPDPRYFSNWQDWAVRLKAAVETAP